MRWVEHVAHYQTNAHKILVEKSEEKTPFVRPRHRWGDIMSRIDLRERGWEGVHLIHLVQNRDQLQAFFLTR
jgi:hypothetical protein